MSEVFNVEKQNAQVHEKGVLRCFRWHAWKGTKPPELLYFNLSQTTSVCKRTSTPEFPPDYSSLFMIILTAN